MVHDALISWLLEHDNPAIRLRTLVELLDRPPSDPEVVRSRKSAADWIRRTMDVNWATEEKGIRLSYRLVALAECGLVREDVSVEKAADRYFAQPFDVNCQDMMTLRALAMLGYGEDERAKSRIETLPAHQLPDGGFLCLHRRRRIRYVPKSCMKNNLHALMLYAECGKRQVPIEGLDNLARYFCNHNMFYRTSDLKTLVLNSRPGSRTIDTFFPFELMRVGLQNVVEAFSALGLGKAVYVDEAWKMLSSKKTDAGQYVLDGTMPQSYIPKERIGKPSKWVTFYATLAEKTR